MTPVLKDIFLYILFGMFCCKNRQAIRWGPTALWDAFGESDHLGHWNSPLGQGTPTVEFAKEHADTPATSWVCFTSYRILHILHASKIL